MHTALECLVVRDAQEQSGECRLLLRRERAQQVLLMLPGDAADLLHSRASGVRQEQRITAAILRMIASLHKPSLLHLVEERHKGARREGQSLAQRPLGETLVNRYQTQHSCMRRRKLVLRKALGESVRGMGADLRKKPCRRCGATHALPISPLHPAP